MTAPDREALRCARTHGIGILAGLYGRTPEEWLRRLTRVFGREATAPLGSIPRRAGRALTHELVEPYLATTGRPGSSIGALSLALDWPDGRTLRSGLVGLGYVVDVRWVYPRRWIGEVPRA